MPPRYTRCVLLAVMLVLSAGYARASDLGDPAPALRIDRWVKGAPVDLANRKDKGITVIDFWTVHCELSRQSIPHLCELQKKFKEKGVVFVGVDWEPPNVVEPFVKKMGGQMDYVVAIDDQAKTAEAYFSSFEVAMDWSPHCFLIGIKGEVLWHGDPLKLDLPLEQILAGTYDLEAAKKALLAQKPPPEPPHDAAWAKAFLAEWMKANQAATSDADAAAGFLEDLIHVGEDPELAPGQIIDRYEACLPDPTLFADIARFTREEVRKGKKPQEWAEAYAQKFRERMLAIERLGAWAEARSALEQHIAAGKMSDADAGNLRALFVALAKADWEPMQVWVTWKGACKVNERDTTYLADFTKFITQESAKGTKGQALLDAAMRQFGERQDAVLKADDRKLRAEMWEGQGKALEQFLEYNKIPAANAGKFRALFADLRKVDLAGGLDYCLQAYEANKGDETYLMDFTEFVSGEVKRGTKAEALSDAIESRFGARRKAAFEAAKDGK